MAATTIRAAREDEAGVVAALAARLFPMACPPAMPAEAIDDYARANLSPARFAGYLRDSDTRVLVADDGSLVGYALLFLGAAGEPADSYGVSRSPTGLLSKCYVDAAYHGTGLAARLLEAAVEEARRAGCAGMWLNANYANHRAQRFYVKHGWAQVGWMDFVVGGRHHHDPVFELVL